MNIGQYTEYYLDDQSKFAFYTELSDSCFKPYSWDLPNFNTSNATLWLRFKVSNVEKESWIIHINQSNLDLVEAQFKGSPLMIKTQSDSIPLNTRDLYNQNYNFYLPNVGSSAEYIYLKVRSTDQLVVPISLMHENSVNSEQLTKDILFSTFFGIMLCLLLYNAFVFLRIKEKVYGNYIIYILFILLAQANLHGYLVRVIPDNFMWINRLSIFFLISFAGIFGLIFISNYIELKKHLPTANKLIKGSIGLYIIAIALSLIGKTQISYTLIEVNGGLNSLLILITCSILYFRHHKPAGTVLLAWSIFFLGVILYILKDAGVLPHNIFTVYTMTIGSAIEGILLSFGLADKINILKKEKEDAQLRELETLKQSEFHLEKQVQERTHQLQEAKEHIETQYQDLQKSQRQLIESEKMAGLGQMTAGIAHELNNPINFVSSNVAPLEKDIEEILEILTDFKNLPHEPTSPEIEAVRSKFRAYDVPMLEEEIKLLMQGIKEGSSRASDIVSGLRIFARTDQDVFVNANLNDCVNATLVLIKSTWKNEVSLNKVLDEHLPDIDCLPGKLNQVIVNLITNAVQASIEYNTERTKRSIHVSSYHDNDNIYLSVTDNGGGIPLDIQTKIFEPFFTTKKVGQGTGLGLSISKSIIEDHNGHLSMKSNPSEGTEFIVTLPRKKTTVAQAA